MLQTKQSVRFCKHFFAYLRSLVSRFRQLLFDKELTHVDDLCFELVEFFFLFLNVMFILQVRLCHSENDQIRVLAATQLYLLAKVCFLILLFF